MNIPFKIYCIHHNVTNRVYIGRSQDIEVRLKRHLEALRGHRHRVEDMQEDFDRYGEDYTITILDNVGYEDRKKEYEWMKKYQSHIRGIGYNYKDTMWNPTPRKPKYTLSFNNKTMPVGDWAVLTNIPYEVIYNRINVLGWDTEKALTTPVGKRGGYYDRKRKRVH